MNPRVFNGGNQNMNTNVWKIWMDLSESILIEKVYYRENYEAALKLALDLEKQYVNRTDFAVVIHVEEVQPL